MKFMYQIILADGEAKSVIASTKTEAISVISDETGMPIEFIKRHFVVRNMGRIR